MKSNIKYFAVFIVIIATITSCFKDDTTIYEIEYPTVAIYSDKEEIPVISGDTLVLSVDSVIETNSEGLRTVINTNSNKYSFRWNYGWNKNGVAFLDTISLDYVLKAQIEGIGSKGLVFTVKDEESGLEYYKNFGLQIGTQFGSGLIVVDTKDGVHSGFHEIQNMYFNPLRSGYK